MARRRSGKKTATRRGDRRKAYQIRRPDWPVLSLGLLGMAITAYLSYTASTATALPLCGEDSACQLIQSSRWSTLFGVPVSVYGLLLYTLIAFVSFEMRPSLKRWRWQWSTALVGVAVSLYLTMIGLVQLQAVCFWCLASLATISAIFLWLSWKRPASAPGGRWRDWLLNTGGATALILAVMQLHYSGLLTPGMGRADPQLEALAMHLEESGARFYGASWCPACQEQKTLFGPAAEALPYVECSPQGRGGLVAGACIRADIRSYPTWIIQGERHESILEPDRLAELSGFRWRDDE